MVNVRAFIELIIGFLFGAAFNFFRRFFLVFHRNNWFDTAFYL